MLEPFRLSSEIKRGFFFSLFATQKQEPDVTAGAGVKSLFMVYEGEIIACNVRINQLLAES